MKRVVDELGLKKVITKREGPTVLEMLSKKPALKKFSQAALDDLIALWIAVENKSFTVVDSEWFQDIFRLLSSNSLNTFVVKKSTFFTNHCMDMYQIRRRNIIKYFEENVSARVSFTTDCWTSPNMHGFMAITAHFIDDEFKLKNFLLDFIPLEKPHTGEYLAEVFLKSLKEFQLQKRISSITLDNASSNVKMLKDLTRMLLQEGITFSEKQGLRCFDHILNIAVQAFISVIEPKRKSKGALPLQGVCLVESQDVPDEEDDISDQNEFENYYNQLEEYTDVSNAKNCIWMLREKLVKIKYSLNLQAELQLLQLSKYKKVSKIVLDVKTRWNSCFYMLRWALKNKDVISLFLIMQALLAMKKFDFKSLDWEFYEKLKSILSTFHEATVRFSKDKDVTIANILLAYDDIIEYVRGLVVEVNQGKQAILHDALNACLGKMEKYYEYFDYPTYYIATSMMLSI